MDVDDVEDDVDNIPIVKLDDDEMEAAAGPSTREPLPCHALLTSAPQPRTKSKVKRKPKSTAPPPDFDRSGEMPEGAAPAARTEAEVAAKSGLAAIDLSAPAPVRGRFDEYTDADDLPPREETPPAKAESPPSAESAGNGAVAPGADVPADEVQAVKIVKVRKKKTKKARAAV